MSFAIAKIINDIRIRKNRRRNLFLIHSIGFFFCLSSNTLEGFKFRWIIPLWWSQLRPRAMSTAYNSTLARGSRCPCSQKVFKWSRVLTQSSVTINAVDERQLLLKFHMGGSSGFVGGAQVLPLGLQLQESRQC